MKNKNFIFVCLLFQLLFLCVTTEMLAQDASKRINEIKRNEAYLFEEATAATEKEARDMAVVKLAKILADYMEENNPEGAKKLDDFKDLAEGAEEIVTDRGSQKRVFLYYSKQDMDATAEEASQIGTSQNVPEQEVANNTTTKPMENIPKPTTKPEIVEEQPKATRPLTDYPNTNPSANKSVSDENLAEWQKRLINSFLTDGLTLLSAKDLVNTYKIENKIKRFGSKTNPPAQTEQSFYVFADETGIVVAVLGRDEGGQRMNYISGNYENLSNHYSQNYIWFTLNK